MNDFVPRVFREVFLGVQLWQWIGLAASLLLAYAVGLFAGSVVVRVFAHFADRTEAKWDDRLVMAMRRPTRFAAGLAALWIAVHQLGLAPDANAVVDRMLQVMLAIAVAWYAIRLVDFGSETIEEHIAGKGADELHMRGVRTQVRVLRRVALIVIGVIGLALVLMQFEAVRSIGVSVLASAGVLGVVLGIAAQRSLGTILAGIQLSITQPVRIGDSVVIEKEFGTVEEITLTYVVVRLWDLRRLVVPIGRFLEQPFENWTKVSPELLGTVTVFATYDVPFDAVRQELERIVKAHGLWDRQTVALQVTDSTEAGVRLRAVVSAADATALWDLRCDVREKLVSFLRTLEDGRYLPKK